MKDSRAASDLAGVGRRCTGPTARFMQAEGQVGRKEVAQQGTQALRPAANHRD